MEASLGGLGRLGRFWMRPGSDLGRRGVSWKRLGRSWRRLRRSCGRLGGDLGRSLRRLGRSWRHLGGVLEAMLSQDRSKKAQDAKTLKKQKKT